LSRFTAHAGDWAVCAVGRLPIGIDIEQIKPIDLDIAERFFTSEEIRDLKQRPSGNQIGYFYEVWMLKESYIKATGMGLYCDLKSFSIKAGDDGISVQIKGCLHQPFYFRQYHIEDGYKLSVCASVNSFPGTVTMLTVETMTGYLDQS